MAQNIVLNGITYVIPDVSEVGWGDNLTHFFVAIPQGVFQKTGGTFSLTADANFGVNFGLVVKYLKSISSNISTAGIIRLAVSDSIGFRNTANNGNLLLTINGSDQLTFNGTAIYPAGITALTGDVTATGPGSVATTIMPGVVFDSMVSAAAGIVRSKLASGSASHVIVNNGAGVLSSEVTLAKVRGGSGQDNSSITFPSSGTLATLAGTESFSNKTFSDAETLTQIATPSSPSSGFNKLYAKSDGNFYNLNSSGIETQIGAGTGGLKNYLGAVNNVNGNGNFELGATTKWSLFNTTLTGVIPTGSISAGAGSVGTFTTVTSGSQLAGTYSLSTASSGAWSAGQGFISDAFTIDQEDQSKTLQFKFYYKVPTNPSNGNFSGTSSNTFAVYIYDVTNSVWIQPGGVYNLIQSAGVGLTSGTFQTTSNSTQYRIAVLAVNASAGAIGLYWDDFFLGPQVSATGAVISDWVSFTPTATNLPTSSTSGRWRRVGDSMEIETWMVASGAATSTIYLNMPTGYSIDYTKTQNPSFPIVGYVSGFRGGVTYVGLVLAENGGTRFFVQGPDGVATWAPTVPSTWANGDELQYQIRVPILGWTAQMPMSNAADSVVSMKATGCTTNSISGNVTLVNPTVKFDTHNSYNNSTGIYTVPVSGYYDVVGAFGMTGGQTLGALQYFMLKLKQNGSTLNPGSLVWGNGTTGAQTQVHITTRVRANAGDTLALDLESGVALTGEPTYGFFQVQRVSGSATIATTGTVPTIQKFTSGSGTYTRAAGSLYLRVRMVGGGGGGGGGGVGTSTSGGAGGDTTFGTTLLSCTGGAGGGNGGTSGGAGGSASLGTGPIGTAVTGGRGDGPGTSGTYSGGGGGAASPFGGAGGGANNHAGYNGATNSGSGGGGGGGPSAPGDSGAGGGAGGFVDAIIGSPSATYSYAIGAAGTAGAAGTSANAGGAGGSGYIEVTEYYQ